MYGNKLSVIFLAGFFILVCAGCVEIQVKKQTTPVAGRKEWMKIGERKVNLKGEKDVISGFGKGRFRQIMIAVHDSAIEMYDIVIIFANNERYSPKTRLHFAESSRSRVIDLPGKERVIKRIEFFYRSKNKRTGRATIEVWGK
ncbi:MAG: hypothetical protein JW881_10810 [Spirochaetales bacterium]|nr:hypothetical protein [Spirochaetales bacterium]